MESRSHKEIMAEKYETARQRNWREEQDKEQGTIATIVSGVAVTLTTLCVAV